ncbi:MAG: hypothetical protein SOZ51_04430 [Eubacteriales bacterium]|nr:hypothetical protein [Eubacteriales bacterium]
MEAVKRDGKMNWKKVLPVVLWVGLTVFAIGAILLLAIAVPRADLAYKRVLSVICAVLMLLISILIGAYLWLSRDTYPNFFLYDRKKRRNIPVDKLTFKTVNERMTFMLTGIADSPEQLWKGDVLLFENEKFGYKSVYKPLVAYKMLFDLGNQGPDSGYWNYLKTAPQENLNAMFDALTKAGEKKMVDALRLLLERTDDDYAKVKEFLRKNLGFIRSRMVYYVVKHIEFFY